MASDGKKGNQEERRQDCQALALQYHRKDSGTSSPAVHPPIRMYQHLSSFPSRRTQRKTQHARATALPTLPYGLSFSTGRRGRELVSMRCGRYVRQYCFSEGPLTGGKQKENLYTPVLYMTALAPHFFTARNNALLRFICLVVSAFWVT